MRIAAAGDLHCTRESQGQLSAFFAEASRQAEVIVLCGDLTDRGLPEEADVLAAELHAASVPVVAVLGNHDHESGRAGDVADRLEAAGVRMLERDSIEIGDVGFAGTKGFCGGFGTHSLGTWGEQPIKDFVQAAIDEELALEAGLARLHTSQRVAVLHYAPIEATVVGEPEQIYPWLGSSRLEEPIDRFSVATVLHGHAHYGAPEGRTRGGARVYNVAQPLLRRLPGEPAYRLVELGAAAPGGG